MLDSITSSPTGPPESIRVRVTEQAGDLWMIPAAAAEALELVKDPDCTVARFAQIVQRDTKLAMDVLSLANSPAMAPAHPIVNLHQAVVRLGFRQCRNLIVSSSVASLLRRVPISQQWILEVLTEHSFTTAIAAAHINRTLTVGFQGEEFTAGLVHDMGRALLAAVYADDFPDADPLDFEEDETTLDRERSVLSTDHCELGSWLLAQNHLPESLVDVIRLHHTPGVESQHTKLVALTAAADHVANHLQRNRTADGYDPANNPGIPILAESGVEHASERFSEVAETLVQAALTDATETCPQTS